MKKKKPFAAVEPYLWLLPSILLMTVFILFPIFEVFRTSMSEVSKAGLIKGFCGLDNFTKVLRGSTFKLVLHNTIVWTVAVVVISTVFGFILALVLNNTFRFRKAVRAIVVFPWATSLIIQAGVWKFIIDKDYGALNTLLMKIGLISSPVNWTPTPQRIFCMGNLCRYLCYRTVCNFLRTFRICRAFDNSYYEAATVDGANYWQKLFKITLPLVKSSLTVSTVLNIIYVFNSFPIIWTITKGDPASRTDTLVTYLYKLAFYKGKSGEAAAVSVIGFLILCLCASIYMVVSLRKEEEIMNNHKRDTKHVILRVLLYLFVILIVLVTLYPYFVMFTTAAKEPCRNLFYRTEPYFRSTGSGRTSRISGHWHRFPDIFINSLIVAGGSTLIAIVCGIPAAYALARMKFKGKKVFPGNRYHLPDVCSV